MAIVLVGPLVVRTTGNPVYSVLQHAEKGGDNDVIGKSTPTGVAKPGISYCTGQEILVCVNSLLRLPTKCRGVRAQVLLHEEGTMSMVEEIRRRTAKRKIIAEMNRQENRSKSLFCW
ncbi:hypothetical protein [Nitrosovibrio sp. Nv17]|uniref:hypothetical protein n=1 Tax=Nitrosovibrio sp. Nv17 TaxID=1855339 RepID=UPI001160D5D7|nr:hypothetical protein [Nitrosovibrio sp. Nv17]